MPVLPVFLALLITFHCSEFILACVYQRKELSFSCESTHGTACACMSCRRTCMLNVRHACM
jgi:hypothetical protein